MSYGIFLVRGQRVRKFETSKLLKKFLLKNHIKTDTVMTEQDTISTSQSAPDSGTTETAGTAAPERLEFNADVYGRSMPLWHYRALPSGMRRAETKDLYRGRCILYRVELGPDTGDWYSDYVRESNYRILCRMIREGKDVWIK